MGFLGVYRALYDYAPRAEGELEIGEDDLLFVLEKNDDDGWWKAKKRAGTDEEDEPTGLVPHNYVEPAPAIRQARAMYEYTRQTDEELSFPEDALLQIFDTTDPDWILAGLDDDFGFVPSNYIDLEDGDASDDPLSEAAPPALPTRPRSTSAQPDADNDIPSPASPSTNPAAAIAGVMQGRAPPQPAAPPSQPPRRPDTPVSDGEPDRSPALPSRPRPNHSVSSSKDYGEPATRESQSAIASHRTPGGFHMYNISEMVSVMGKRKKMPTTLGINLGTGTILIAPERAQDDPPQEWTADKMTHYSREGKHVFMELVRPSKSIDFHAGAKDTAEEIVSALGELAGAVRAEGLKEVILAGTQSHLRKGKVLYDFMAQGDDEVTVAAGDEVIILDDSKSEEWWQLRRIKNGKEGVVPSSYIEIIGAITPPQPTTDLRIASGMSTVDQNRMEEIRLTKEALKASKEPEQQRSKRENGRGESSSNHKSKSKPDSSKVRTWTDRSKSFNVEAQFLGLKDGKIHLHKLNGVKIAVPIAKMSRDDLEYVENMTGISLDDERPLADVKRSKSSSMPAESSGATVERNQKPEYDWFQFFLSCDVPVGLCERYAQAFSRDSMDESVLPDVNATILRTLGLREGDIIKVMRTLDAKYDRERSNSTGGDGPSGGLFSGPGGALRNNTRKGRPAPAVQTSDVVDASAFSKDSGNSAEGATSPSPTRAPVKAASGFDDDAWEVKPSKKSQPETDAKAAGQALTTASTPPKAIPTLTGSMKDLSMLTAPLEPTKSGAQPTSSASTNGADGTATSSAQGQALPVASPSFFSSVAAGQASPKSLARQRPTPAPISPNQSGLVPPPPQRPLSAPQTAQQSAYHAPPLGPQRTGAVQGQVAPPGQSLNDITQARLQQQYAAQMQQMQQMQPAITGYQGMQGPGMAPYQSGTSAQFMQPMYTGAPPTQSPFQDPVRTGQFSPLQAQQTGYRQQYQPQQSFGQTPSGNVNNYLPPALEPQRTGMSSMQTQPTGYSSFSQQQPPQPLQPQKTGPPPPVRFGVTNETEKLTPQATGRRANLAQATPQNPFGF